MPILLRTNRDDYPGAAVEITNPFTCATYPSFQLLAKAIQEGAVEGHGATIVSGRILTSLSDSQIQVLCSV